MLFLQKIMLLQLETTKSGYNSLYDYIIQGNVIRSRANWYERGEKSNKYFLNLESRKIATPASANSLTKVVN